MLYLSPFEQRVQMQEAVTGLDYFDEEGSHCCRTCSNRSRDFRHDYFCDSLHELAVSIKFRGSRFVVENTGSGICNRYECDEEAFYALNGELPHEDPVNLASCNGLARGSDFPASMRG